jgi:hypothetical protein
VKSPRFVLSSALWQAMRLSTEWIGDAGNILAHRIKAFGATSQLLVQIKAPQPRFLHFQYFQSLLRDNLQFD